jgi:3-oxoacyl-[acyl-carrier protein] reductase
MPAPLPQQRAVIVTGGGGAIGRATALRFAHDGARVIVVDRDGAAATQVAESLPGPDHRAITCDVADRAAVEVAVDQVLGLYGRIDVLVAAAGINRDNLVFRMSDEDWISVLETNLSGAFYFVRACQRPMVTQSSGKIVLVSSRAALGNRGQVNYSAAKAGLQGMARSLALELGPFGINVNAVAPGFVETPMTLRTAQRIGVTFEEFKADVLERTPRRVLGQPEHIASVIAFLAHEDSLYVHGQTIYATGGPTV